jgi:hypothetical protein
VKFNVATSVEFIENAVIDAVKISKALNLRAVMGRHPITYADPRVRGFMLEMRKTPQNFTRLSHELPELFVPLSRFEEHESNFILLAVNQYPPTDRDEFLLKPHIDRNYQNKIFDLELAPLSTVVAFLDFPECAVGGELVVFPAEAFSESSESIPRENARSTVERYEGQLVQPVPGSACILRGPVIHAVLGYEAPVESRWRTVLVIAQFHIPDDAAVFSPFRYHLGA